MRLGQHPEMETRLVAKKSKNQTVASASELSDLLLLKYAGWMCGPTLKVLGRLSITPDVYDQPQTRFTAAAVTSCCLT